MKQNFSIASQKAIKSSPVKVMRVTKNISGLNVSDSLRLLKYSKLKVASTVMKLIYSAMSNAENNHNMDLDKLFIKEINVGRAFVLKRFAARGRGKSSRILKTYSNVSVILAEKSSDEISKIKKEEK